MNMPRVLKTLNALRGDKVTENTFTSMVWFLSHVNQTRTHAKVSEYLDGFSLKSLIIFRRYPYTSIFGDNFKRNS